MQVIDALTVGPRILAPVEMVESPVWKYKWASLYSGIRFGEEAKSLELLRRARRHWLSHQEQIIVEEDKRLGEWRVHILDTTDYPRAKAATVPRGYAHSAQGMRVGHNLSILSQRVARGSWTLPLEILLIDVGENAGLFGAKQVAEYARRVGWQPNDILAVDAYYTKAPYLRPMNEVGANVLGRAAANRVFYLPPPPYCGRGRPPLKGRKIKLNDGRTLPATDAQEEVNLPDGGTVLISRWDDVRMRGWLSKRLVLYRVIEYRCDGKARYRRPLWLIYVPTEKVAIPSPAEAAAIYDCRFGIEHSLRFFKQELSLTAAQFNGSDALERIALWVELVATAYWQLFALRALADLQEHSLPSRWRNAKLSPRVVRRIALALFNKFGITSPKPKPRGKSPGRAMGTRFAPRKRYRVYRKRKRRVIA